MTGVCIYCGKTAEDVDHVPPKCLFQKPRPSGLVKVPCCKKCNRRFGIDDEYFRDSLALSTYEAAEPPELKTLHEAVRRSLLRKAFALRRDGYWSAHAVGGHSIVRRLSSR